MLNGQHTLLVPIYAQIYTSPGREVAVGAKQGKIIHVSIQGLPGSSLDQASEKVSLLLGISRVSAARFFTY